MATKRKVYRVAITVDTDAWRDDEYFTDESDQEILQSIENVVDIAVHDAFAHLRPHVITSVLVS